MQQINLLTVKVNNQVFGFDLNKVASVHNASQINSNLIPCPSSPSYVKGVAKFYEEIIQAWSLSTLLRLETEVMSRFCAYVVLEHSNRKIALEVTEVIGVQKVSKENIQQVAGICSSYAIENNQIITILDDRELLKSYQEEYPLQDIKI